MTEQFYKDLAAVFSKHFVAVDGDIKIGRQAEKNFEADVSIRWDGNIINKVKIYVTRTIEFNSDMYETITMV